MAWVEVHQTLPGHPKLSFCRRQLNVSRHAMIGHLVLLWLWGLDSADMDGRLSPLVTAEDLAEVAEWPGNPGEFVKTLMDAGFLERAEDGTIVIHDWREYGGKLLKKRLDARERQRRSRERKRGHADVTRSSRVTSRDGHVDVTPESRYKIRLDKIRLDKTREDKRRERETRENPSPAPNGAGRKVKSRAADDRVQPVIDHYHTRYAELFGGPPVIQGGRDGALIRGIPKEYDAATICAVMDEWFEHRDDPYVWRDGDIPSFVRVFNRLRSGAARAGTKKDELPRAFQSLVDYLRSEEGQV